MDLSGKKTYLVALAMAAYAIGGFFAGQLGFSAAIQAFLTALGLAGIRHGIETGAEFFEKSLPGEQTPPTQ